MLKYLRLCIKVFTKETNFEVFIVIITRRSIASIFSDFLNM